MLPHTRHLTVDKKRKILGVTNTVQMCGLARASMFPSLS